MSFSFLKSKESKEVIFVVGKPYSGKTHNCRKLVESNPSIALIGGGVVGGEGSLDDKIRDIVGAISSNATATKFLIDGFPTKIEEVGLWTDTAGQHGLSLSCVLYLSCPDDILITRAREGGFVTGEEEEATLFMRLVDAQNDMAPVIAHFASLGLLKEVATDQDEDAVFEFFTENF